MPSHSTWLYDRLRSEQEDGDRAERWKTILSRLARLTRVDKSTACFPHGSQGNLSPESEAAKNHWDQFIAQLGKQGKSGGRAEADKSKEFVRGNVGALREPRPEDQAMTRGELRLAALAGALIGSSQTLTPAEQRLLARTSVPSRQAVIECATRIRDGEDALGDEFCRLRSAQRRRETGATYTPSAIVDAMVSWAAGIDSAPERVVDPGVGSGRFLSAAAERFPNAKLVGIDIDPLALLMTRANARVRGYANRLQLHLDDYRAVQLRSCRGRTLYIGNPPYIRHHDISDRWKSWFANTAHRLGFKVSKLAGLHVHFFLRTREIAATGDFGAFITAAEWLDVNYGSALRSMLANGLGGCAVHVIDPKAQPFADAFTTGAITCFQVGNRPTHFSIRAVHRLQDLAPLDQGRLVDWDQMEKTPRWSVFVRDRKEPPAGFIELGELFRVHRGQVTGTNKVWIAGEMAALIPRRYLRPAITKARELFGAGAELVSTSGLRRVVDLPASLDELSDDERQSVRKYLAWARSLGADQSYTAQHRRAWWAVELRTPAPVLVTYMARRVPTFVLNTAKARHLNIAHGLYPRIPLSNEQFAAVLSWLRKHICLSSGRVYAGGLVKFEPRELERIPIPALEDIHAASSADQVDETAACERRRRGDRHLSA
jgi:hypothetical protein